MSKSVSSRSDSALRTWASNTATILNSQGASYGLTTAQTTLFELKAQNFYNAMTLASDPPQRTTVTVAAKDSARKQLEIVAKNIVAIILSDAGVTPEQKAAIDISDRKPPTPRPEPQSAPSVDILSVDGRTVKARLHGEQPGRRGKPSGVMAANIFTYVSTNGTEAPTDVNEWKFQGTTTRPIVEVDFDPSASAGTAWITACWFNARGCGPAAAPISVNLPAGNVLPQTMRMSIAA